MARVAFITVTRNSDCIRDLLVSVFAKHIISPPDIGGHILTTWQIIDNGSSVENTNALYDILDFIRKEFLKNTMESIEVNHYYDKNYLFTEANNIAIKMILEYFESDYIFLINPDIELLDENPFSAIIDFMEKNKLVGICGCKLLFPDGLIEFAGGIDNSHRAYRQSNNEFNIYEEVEWITGAFMCIRTVVFKTIGLFDPLLTHWVSDHEFCRRAALAGFSSYYIPVSVQHNQGTSTGNNAHAEVQLDLPSWIKPNSIPISLDEIKLIATNNYLKTKYWV